MSFSDAEIENTLAERIFALTQKRITSTTEELIESGILSSLSMAELAVDLEKAFSVSFSFMEVNRENFSTPGSLKKLLLQKLH